MPLLFPATPPLLLCCAARASRRATAAVASAARSSSSSSASFDAAALEAERLRLDAATRAGMETTAAAAEADPRAWKWAIRKRVWDALEAEGVARDPRPVHHRIPNFDGAPAAADALGRLDIFQNSQCVKVNPDTPQKQVRFLTLSELEYGMLRYMGAIDDSTMIVTTVHDKQLVDDIPVEKLLVHDVPVGIICTPTQVIFTKTTIPKPQGIYWEKLSPEKLGQIRILRELKQRIEQETGTILPCGPSEKLPPTAQRRQRWRRRR
ncbi:unnamed protein product [Miscanthus lutarioriparius]|uniref:Uncharacterized protein n=1 Tax=Miscanthus lutarioriparius TaxID=422564 RepID=A0A811RE53_9POAL|nr:unnamed protein product [Miscanthus lutarioriparius]